MLNCRQITELVTDYLEGKMPLGTRLRFHLHVGMCKHCRAYLRQMKMTIETVGHLPAAPIPDDVRDQLLQRFRGWNRGPSG